jgi:hypothetical protein
VVSVRSDGLRVLRDKKTCPNAWIGAREKKIGLDLNEFVLRG